jgi:hypothetical protein
MVGEHGYVKQHISPGEREEQARKKQAGSYRVKVQSGLHVSYFRGSAFGTLNMTLRS